MSVNNYRGSSQHLCLLPSTATFNERSSVGDYSHLGFNGAQHYNLYSCVIFELLRGHLLSKCLIASLLCCSDCPIAASDAEQGRYETPLREMAA